ncbi:hypothetical protein [Flaviaesturariibacter amylovorans]|uniref:Carrier domain-containing protein n=1 Tax=Flaviaesturariibacter amylovorans TaxID=1084520 RepID=A0ABP8HDY4_9BACT
MGLDTVELIVRIEQHFAICIPDAEAERIATVQDLADAVLRHSGPPPNLVAEITRRVVELVADHAGRDPDAVLLAHSLTSDLGLD